MKLKFEIGWYHGADFALFILTILEIGDELVTIFSIQIARFIIGVHLW